MLRIETIVVSDFAQNCRIVWDSEDSKALVIDPGGDVELILEKLSDLKLTCDQIWLTHSHVDHCGGVKSLKDLTGNPALYGHKDEMEYRAKVREICSMYGVPAGEMQNCPEPEHYVKGGELLKFGQHEFKALFTPGHSPGHLSFYNQANKIVLAGDALFAGSIGRTDFPGCSHETLISSIREKLLTLPDDTRVLSGHGGETTIGVEKKTNPFLRDK